MNDVIDYDKVKNFWDKRAELPLSQEQINFVSLDNKLGKKKYDAEKIKLLKEIKLDPKKKDFILDLGAGWGRLILQLGLHKKAYSVVAVDYCEGLIKKGKQYFEEQNIWNVIFKVSSAGKYTSLIKFDIIIISGVLLFLNDDEIEMLIKNMNDYSKLGTKLYVRDNTGINGRFLVKNKFSEELKTEYNAIYRSREEIILIFRRAGFSLIKDEDMFKEGDDLNRRKETRSRLYVFEKLR